MIKSKELISSGCILVGVAFGVLTHTPHALCQGDKSLLVRAPGKKLLYRKVIVTNKTKMLKNVGDAGGPPVSPFSIFFLLNSEDGATETKGHVRVGTSKSA